MLRGLFVGVCCLLCLSCAQPGEPPGETAADRPAGEAAASDEWLETSLETMTETQRAQQELVAAATNAMFSELMGELMAALDEGGPAAAIEVCRNTAPMVAGNVSAQYGVDLGRTSHRLRNPANIAPGWANEFVDERAEMPVYLVGPHGELGVLLPIKMKAECQMCHGPAEMIDANVMAAISESYPEDEAVGFTEGELRGWMWVEAPPGGVVDVDEAAG